MTLSGNLNFVTNGCSQNGSCTVSDGVSYRSANSKQQGKFEAIGSTIKKAVVTHLGDYMATKSNVQWESVSLTGGTNLFKKPSFVDSTILINNSQVAGGFDLNAVSEAMEGKILKTTIVPDFTRRSMTSSSAITLTGDYPITLLISHLDTDLRDAPAEYRLVNGKGLGEHEVIGGSNNNSFTTDDGLISGAKLTTTSNTFKAMESALEEETVRTDDSERKQKNFIGMDADEAKKIIEEQYPEIVVVSILPLNAIVTADYRKDRALLFANDSNIIERVRAPGIH